MSTSPFADYTVAGHDWTGGLAGVIGVVVTLAVAGAAFWVIARTKPETKRRRIGMGAGHAHPLYRDGDSVVHCAPAEVKIVCLVVFVLAVVATPRETIWPFALYGVIIVSVWGLARIPLRWILPRMLIEAPFLVLAALLPFAEGGERIEVAGLSLSVSGLYAAWGIVIKGTLGVAASLTVAATTTARELPIALSRLGVPAMMTSVLSHAALYRVLAAEAGGCEWRGCPAATRRAPSTRSQPSPNRLGRFSCAPTSAVSGRTWRCCRAASTGRHPSCPESAAPPGQRAQWSVALVPAACAVLVATSAWIVR